jgi:preprotein translocase subunit SecA
MRKDVLHALFRAHVPPNSIDEQWDLEGLEQTLANEFGVELPIRQWLEDEEQITDDEIYDRMLGHFEDSYRAKVEMLGDELIVRLEKEITLMILDRHWKEHLAAMDYLRQGIGLRGYAQKNPVQEFKRESFEMFTGMLDSINYEVVQALTRVQIRGEEQVEALEQSHQPDQAIKMEHASAQNPFEDAGQQDEDAAQPYVRKERKIGRNEPCWCGSGKKFKQCHGKL